MTVTVEAVVFQRPVPEQKRKIYLPLGRWKIRVPRRKPVRIGLAVVMLLRGLVPTPTSPFHISGAVTLLSMDMPRLRRWRRKLAVRVGHRARRPNGTGSPADTAAADLGAKT